MKGRSPTPEPPKEVGLLDKLRLKEEQEDVSHDRVQEIMQQLASGATVRLTHHFVFVKTILKGDTARAIRSKLFKSRHV